MRLFGMLKSPSRRLKDTLQSLRLHAYFNDVVTEVPLFVDEHKHAVKIYVRKQAVEMTGISRLVFAKDTTPSAVHAFMMDRNKELDGFGWQFWQAWGSDIFSVDSRLPIGELSAQTLGDRLIGMFQELEHCRQAVEACKSIAASRSRRRQYVRTRE